MKELKRFGEDPPSESFRVVVAPKPLEFDIPELTGDVSADANAYDVLQSLFEALSYLNAANESFDRYAAAYAARDNVAAALQMNAIGRFMYQYDLAVPRFLAKAEKWRAAMEAVPELTTPVNSRNLEQLQIQIRELGLAAAERELLRSGGLSDAAIDAAVQHFLALDPHQVSGTVAGLFDTASRTLGMSTTKFADAPPLADAGPDQIANVHELVTISGTGTSLGDRPLQYHWRQTGGPLVAMLGSDSAEASFTAAANGDYVFELVVADRGIGSLPDFVKVTIAGDETPPTIASVVEGPSGANGWYLGDVTVNWTVGDNESAVLTSQGCGPAAITSDTTGISLTCTATSAGGTSSTSVTIKRDTTPPTLTFGASSPAANAVGWHKTAVDIPYTAADATSGVAISMPVSPVNISMQGEGVTRTVTVTDVAGNSAAFTTPPVNIDGTVPAVSIASPNDGASYLKNGQLLASYSCSDAVSGIAKCEGTAANGASIDTSVEGDFNFRVTVEDHAGNSNSKTHRYSIVVRYSFGGFFAPVDNSPTVNAVKAGRTVPIKWSLMSGEGQYVSDLSTFRSLTSQPVACLSGAPIDAVEESLTAGTSGLRYDAGSQQFIYNWKTSSAWAGTCRRLVLDLSDGQRQEAVFRLQ